MNSLGRALPGLPNALGWLLLVLLLPLYLLLGGFLPGNDAKPGLYGAVNLATQGRLYFLPTEEPFFFVWDYQSPRGQRLVSLDSLEEDLDGLPARAHLAQGRLALHGPKYFLSQGQNRGYYSIFGPAPALVMAVPLLPLAPFLGRDRLLEPAFLWSFGHLFAALLSLASLLLLYACFSRLGSPQAALWSTLLLGLGTNVLVLYSRAPWQQTFSFFFQSLGLYLLFPSRRPLAGLALGLAVFCRPAALGLGLLPLLARPKKPGTVVLTLGLFALPVLGLLLNNALTFGDPLSFGQASAGAALVAMKAGHDRVFGDGVWRAALGLLASPSRGLLVFYPALAFSALGLALLARRPALRQKTGLGPAMLSLPLLALFVVPALWFDWWGGWCYGPRLMGDLLPLLGLLFMLFVDQARGESSRPWRSLKALALALTLISVSISALGAFSYDLHSWNGRRLATFQTSAGQLTVEQESKQEGQLLEMGLRPTAIQDQDIDRHQNHQRLWSWTDSQILHYLFNLPESRQRLKQLQESWLAYPKS
jgi:hypothetical protein